MVSLDELNQLHSNICLALGDPKRIQILYALYEQPSNVTALAETLSTPQPTISRHLSILRERGLVKRERDGASVIYSITYPQIMDALEIMRGILRATIEDRASTLS